MHPFTHLQIALLFALIATHLPLAAQQEDEQRGTFAMNVFHSVCLLGKGDAALPAQYPEYRLRELLPEAQAQFLRSRPGKVWAAQVPYGNFAVVITEDRECSVYVRRIAQRVALGRFEFTLRNFAQKGTLKEEPPVSKPVPHVQMDTRSFSLVSDFDATPYMAVISTSESEQAPLQAIFTARMTR